MHAHQGRDLLAIQLGQMGQDGEQDHTGDRTDAFGTAQKTVLVPEAGRVLYILLDLLGELCDLLLQRGEMRCTPAGSLYGGAKQVLFSTTLHL